MILSALAAAVGAAPGRARGDEIVFKKKYGGEKVKCQIYKETADYIHYIDLKRKMACGCSREIVEKIVKAKKPLLDVEAFFLKKVQEARDAKEREKAEKLAAELRKKRLAAEAASKKQKDKKTDDSKGKRIGRCLVKPATEKTGIKVLRTKDTGSSELLVDPFPEEPAKAGPGANDGKTGGAKPKPESSGKVRGKRGPEK
jgi:hypothetical protein